MNQITYHTQTSLNLVGHFLVSMPQLENTIFSNTVIFICQHNEQGAMGVVVNKPALMQLEGLFDRTLVDNAAPLYLDHGVHFGGPVSSDHGFVLHSTERPWESSLTINSDVALNTSIDILHSIITGNQCPQQFLIALGCASWDSGQLENELSMNYWLVCPFVRRLLFTEPLENRYQLTFDHMGFDQHAMSSFVGHA